MVQQTLEITKQKIIDFLSSISLFSGIPADVLKDLADGFEIAYLVGGGCLIQQNETGDSLYVLMYGLLRVIKLEMNGQEKVLADLDSGSIVGEIACLISEPRTASVYAVRDSVLLKMTRKVFDSFISKYPETMMNIARQAVKRLVYPKDARQRHRVMSLVVVPAGNYKISMDLIHAFIKKISIYGKALLLTEAVFNDILGAGASEIPIENEKNTEIIAKIHELESTHRFLIYIADKPNAWTYRCIRQADKIVLVGQHSDSPGLGAVEHIVFNQKSKLVPNVDLVLISDQNASRPQGTRVWFQGRNISRHYHVRLNVEADYARFVRLITGHGLGVVLSGGGAAALGHVGVIKAMNELKIPIDYVAGASMGAIISALDAYGMDADAMTEALKSFLHQFMHHFDYTLPVSAILKGKYMGHLLRKCFGEETMIEDLWKSYFCISTNLGTNAVLVHEVNLLWRAIRASISLPGIFPPIHDEHNHLLVDGGLLNNLPVDEMQRRINRGKVLASSLKIINEAVLDLGELEDDTVSGWYLFMKHMVWQKLWKYSKNKKKNFPSFVSVLHHSMLIASGKHQQEMVKQADYNIIIDVGDTWMLDFKPMDKIIERGYITAMTQLQEMDFSYKKE